MKSLPLILIFALLRVNTPFSALPKEPEAPEKPEPVTLIEDAAAWDAMFSPAAMENVTYTTHTEIYSAGGGVQDTVTLRDGDLLEYRSADGSVSTEEYLPEEGLLAVCTSSEDGLIFSYSALTPEDWDDMSCFYLERQYAGRFDDAVYDAENGVYRLTNEYTASSIRAEDGRLVQLIVGNAAFSSESFFTDYGTTAVETLPERDSEVTADEWAFAFSGEGLKNHAAYTTGYNPNGAFSSSQIIGSNVATLDVYGAPTEEYPNGTTIRTGSKNTADGVTSFVYHFPEGYWVPASRDSSISWEDAIVDFAGLRGFAEAFEDAVYDAEKGCYTFTLDRGGLDVQYAVYFSDGGLLCVTAAFEGGSMRTVFQPFVNMFEEDWIPDSAVWSVGK